MGELRTQDFRREQETCARGSLLHRVQPADELVDEKHDVDEKHELD